MTKRPSPSEAYFEPQHKVHISEKEVSHGTVPNSVYDKTLRLLFEGARNLKPSNGTNFTNLTMKRAVSVGSHTPLKQMFINSHYKLEAESADKVYSGDIHLCYSVTSEENMSKCGFCEKGICEECTVTCAHCKVEYCKTCSLCIYSADLDYLCLGCCE